MEIIFTLILLIGIGINSHRYDIRNKEVPKQEVTSFIEEDSNNNQLQVLSNTEGEIDFNIEINNELSEAIQKSESRKMESKGKYISVRINDGNG
ncbi:MAG: hypothetical protein JST55_03095 [Bacteroidetes bacterium]|nr:hypothetical protein [Bacteroidota bacterium]